MAVGSRRNIRANVFVSDRVTTIELEVKDGEKESKSLCSYCVWSGRGPKRVKAGFIPERVMKDELPSAP